MTIVDSSVWFNHFRSSNSILLRLDAEGSVAVHPFIVGEIVCGNLPGRAAAIRRFRALPQSPIAPEDEVHRVIEEKRLWGTGLNWVDMHILVSAASSGWDLLTADVPMQKAARLLGIVTR